MILKNGLKKISLKLSFLILILISSNFVFSQIKISGIASSYSGDILKIYKTADRITYTKQLLDTALVSDSGFFKFNLSLENIQKVYIDLPHVKTFLYVKPNNTYKIRIPVKKKLTDAQLGNPYFRKDNISAFVVNSSDSTHKLITAYNAFIKKNRKKLVLLKNDSLIFNYFDSLKIVSDSVFDNFNNDFFEKYRIYSLAILEYIFIKTDKKEFIDSFFINKPILFNLPPYMNLFNFVFDNYFEPDNKLVELTKIYKNIMNYNFNNIVTSLCNDSVKMQRELAELVALKALYDKFYTSEKAKNDIIFTIQNINTEKIQPHSKIISENIYKNITKLKEGFPLYNFKLPDEKNNYIYLKEFTDKNFIYLNFIHPSSGHGLKHLPLLQKYDEMKIKDLKILTVFVGDSLKQMQNFLKENKNYKWKFLFTKINNPIIKEYNIVAFPMYFLITPDGNLATKHTPSPEEEFEQTYNSVYKKWQRKKQNSKTIK